VFPEGVHVFAADGFHHLDADEAIESTLPRLRHRPIVHKMDANPVFESFLPYPFHGEISLGDRKCKRVDLGIGDGSDDGDRHGTPARTDFQDAMARFDLCLGDDMTDFTHLGRLQVVEDVLGRRGGGRRGGGNVVVAEVGDGIISFSGS